MLRNSDAVAGVELFDELWRLASVDLDAEDEAVVEDDDKERFCPVFVEELPLVAAAEDDVAAAAPNQSKGLAKGFTALRLETGVAAALKGGLSIVAAAAAAE